MIDFLEMLHSSEESGMEKRVAAFAARIAKSPDSPHVDLWLAWIDAIRGNIDALRAHLTKAERSPVPLVRNEARRLSVWFGGEANPLQTLREIAGDTDPSALLEMELGNAALQEGNVDSAIGHFRKAVDLVSSEDIEMNALSIAATTCLRVMWDSGRTEEARQLVSQLRTKFPLRSDVAALDDLLNSLRLDADSSQP
jgi:Flp pilus assembly protein TadD